ncbi:AAA family ATPase [Pseudomonas sichuanensis]
MSTETPQQNVQTEDDCFEFFVERISRSLDTGKGPHQTYLIGNNGTGKSRLLSGLAEEFAEDERCTAIGCITNSLYDRFKRTQRGVIQYLGARTSNNAVFHSAIDRLLAVALIKCVTRKKVSVTRLETTLDMVFLAEINTRKRTRIEDLVDGRKFKGSSISAFLNKTEIKILEDLRYRRFRLSQLSAAQISAFGKYLDLNGEVIMWSKLPGRGKPALEFEALSTGEQNRALMYSKILSVAREGSILLIDEPEISLHLNWQMAFHRSLCELLKGLKRYHVVIATHAPVIISQGVQDGLEHKDVDLADTSVVVLERKKDQDGALQFSFKEHPLESVVSHDSLVLMDFNTALFRTAAVDIEIAESVLEAVDYPSMIKEVIERLKNLEDTPGVTKADKQNLHSAIDIVRRHVAAMSEDGANA